MNTGADRPDLNPMLRPMMLFRLIIATAFLFVASLVLQGNTYPFYVLIGIFYFLTIFYLPVVQSRPLPGSLPSIQIVVDVIIVTCLVGVARSVGGVFLFLYLIPIVSASLYYDMKQSIGVALCCGFMYCLIILYKHYAGYSDGAVATGSLLYTMFLNLVIFYVVGFLCGYLAKLVSMKGQELSELQSLHNLILQNMNSGLISVGNDGRIVYTNSAAEQMLGYSHVELNGKPLSELFLHVHEDTRSPFDMSGAQGQHDGESRAEAMGITSTGEEIPIGYNISVIRDQESRTVGQIIVFTDLRKVKKLEKKLRQADKLKAVGELAAGIAHEIRNPLAAISGSIEMLVDCTDGDEANRRLFEVVLKESSRLNDIIEGFLNYTRPKPPDLQRVDVSELLEEVVLLMRNDPAVSTGIKIWIDRRSDEVEIEGDPGHLKQVFINLIKNAADAIGECGEIRLSVARDPCGRLLSVVVSDTGCGMDESQLKDVFNPFFTTKTNGMGIGLSVAEKLIRSHGGQISVESRTGEGTAFTISLPCRREQGHMAGIEAYGENTYS